MVSKSAANRDRLAAGGGPIAGGGPGPPGRWGLLGLAAAVPGAGAEPLSLPAHPPESSRA